MYLVISRKDLGITRKELDMLKLSAFLSLFICKRRDDELELLVLFSLLILLFYIKYESVFRTIWLNEFKDNNISGFISSSISQGRNCRDIFSSFLCEVYMTVKIKRGRSKLQNLCPIPIVNYAQIISTLYVFQTII